MRVLHYRYTFSRLSETFIYAYITELERQGVDNHVMTLNRRNEEQRPFSKVQSVDEDRWHPRRIWYRMCLLGRKNASHRSTQMLMDKRMRDSIQEVDPDVIHAHFGPEATRMAPHADHLGIPLIATFYGYDVSELPEEGDWREKYEELWPRADAVTVLSEQMEEAVRDLGCPADKLNVVHLSRDLDDFPYEPPNRRVQTLLFVGRLVEKKAPLDAVRAVELANRRDADLNLEIAGSGDLREELEAYVQEHGLSEHVTVLGEVPSSVVSQRMRDADAFILPSKTAPSGNKEGTPTVLVEAQASGLPCVSTRHAGIPEMLPEANHDLLAGEGDVEALAEILQDLSSRTVDELVDVADRGRRKVEDEFDLSREAGKLRRIYSRISTPEDENAKLAETS
ncbi:colanic acid/amylovoran biosynthesis glycosyltransferase [Salinibacter ruber]|uniref:glycosyltransferase n=1 Tax=Salinibacter ruber TaxID=146919 RepID=UPI00216A5AC8|nr:glycosyltransferase [Salinibacter ruber]MCS4156036.1 colanic acid/amylovoran biosynthesis glycosyltransferase [Salinibacter ruber]